MTMSTSSAPSMVAPRASKTFTSVLCVPSGKPTTVQVSTPVPSSAFLTVSTHTGFTQTDLKWCAAASSQSCKISA